MTAEQQPRPAAGHLPRDLRALGKRAASRRIVGTLVRSLLGAVVLLTVYYARPETWETRTEVVVRIVAMMLAIAAVLVWQIVAIARSPFPQLRAVEALTSTVTLMVVSFATVYVIMSDHDPAAFSEQLNRTGALYFTLTTLATVGYGDIHARTDAARIVVMLQMVFNVAVIGASARLILGAARRRAGAETPAAERST